MSALENAVDGIIGDYIEVEPEEVTSVRKNVHGPDEKLAGFDIIAIIALFEAIFPMIQSLIEGCNVSNRRLSYRMRKPNRRQRRFFRSKMDDALHDVDLWSPEARDIADTALEYCRFSSRREVGNVIDECRTGSAS